MTIAAPVVTDPVDRLTLSTADARTATTNGQSIAFPNACICAADD